MVAIAALDWSMIGFTSIGVLILWGRLGPKDIEMFALSKLIRSLISNRTVTMLLELAVFLVLGVIVALSFIKPESAAHAIAAGMGWTAFVSQPSKENRLPAG